MPLSAYQEAMKKLYSARLAHVSSEPTQLLFCRGLKYLMDHTAVFDACVDENNPFYQEFVKLLNAGLSNDEDCFSLFECLAIFFRLKQHDNPDQVQSDIEKQVLNYFENSGEWQPQDNTLVSLWYWWRIPSLPAN